MEVAVHVLGIGCGLAYGFTYPIFPRRAVSTPQCLLYAIPLAVSGSLTAGKLTLLQPGGSELASEISKAVAGTAMEIFCAVLVGKLILIIAPLVRRGGARITFWWKKGK